MAFLPPMDWSEMATKSDLRELELRLSSHMDHALRQQTQWVFGPSLRSAWRFWSQS